MADLPRPGAPVRGSATGRPIMALFDLASRRWTLRVLWELSQAGESVTFRELRARCADMSSSVLTKRVAELRRMHVLDRQPLSLRQGEELLGDPPHAGHELVGHAVADEVSGADAVEGVAQRLDERRAGGAVGVRTEVGDVQDGERGRCAHPHQLMGRAPEGRAARLAAPRICAAVHAPGAS